MLHGLGAVHAHPQGLHRVLQPVGHIHGAVHLLHPGGDGPGGGLQRLHILTIDVQRHAVAGNVAHHAGHDIVRRYLTVHIGAQRLDLFAGIGAGIILRHGDVNGGVVRAAAKGHHGLGGIRLDHGAHGVHALHRHAAAGHLVGIGHGLLTGTALRHGDGHVDVVDIHLRHEAEAPADSENTGKDQQRQRTGQHRRLVIQRPADGLLIGGIDLIQQPRLLHQRTLEHTAGHGGHHGQRHQQAGQQRIGHGQGQIGEQLPCQTLHEHNGGEHAHGGQRTGRDGAQHLLRAGHGGLHHRGAPGTEPVDILDDHHGVIHQHTHRHRKAAEGDHVDGNAGEVHQHDGEDHADGNGDQGDEGGPPVPQEQEQHHHGEQCAPQQGREDGLHDQVDIVALIHQRLKAEALVLLRQLVQPGRDVVRHLRRGVVGLLAEGGDDAVVAVELGVDLIGVIGIEHGGHIAEADGLHALDAQIEQHHVLQLFGGGDLVVHGYHIADAVLIGYVAGGHREVLGCQQLLDHGHRQHAVQIQLLQHLLAGLGQLLFPFLDLLHGQLQLHIALGHQQHAVHQRLHAAGDLVAQRVEPVGVVEECLNIRDGFFHLVNALLDLLLGTFRHQRRQGLGIFRHTLGQLQIGRSQRFVFRRCGGLFLLGGRITVDDGLISGDLIDVGGHLRLVGGDALPQGLLLLRHVGGDVHGLLQGVHRLIQRAGHAVADAVGSLGDALVQRLLRLGHLLFGAAELARRLIQQLAGILTDGLRQIRHFFRVQHHMHLTVHRAGDLHTGHAGNARQLGAQLLLHEVAQLVDVHAVAADGGHHDGDHGGVHLQDIGRGHRIIPLPLQGGHLLLDIHAQRVHVDAALKLHHDHGDAVLAGGGDAFQLVQRGQRLFQRLGDLRLHAFGACAGVAGDHDHIGVVHVGEQIGGHLHIGHHAQYQNGQRRHKDR